MWRVKISSQFTSPEDPDWKPIADINHDGIVDLFDLLKVARYFGWAYP